MKNNSVKLIDIRDRLLASSTDVIELMHILATGKDPLNVLEGLDFPPSPRLLTAMYKEIANIAKTAVPKVPMSKRYASATDKKQAEMIIQEVYSGELEVGLAKDLLSMLANKVHAIEMVRLKEQLELAAGVGDDGTDAKIGNTAYRVNQLKDMSEQDIERELKATMDRISEGY